MDNNRYRILLVTKGMVQCLLTKKEPVQHCRLCIHAREFLIQGKYVKSPSLAYCVKSRVTDEVDLKKIESVKCADRQAEGFHNIANIIG